MRTPCPPHPRPRTFLLAALAAGSAMACTDPGAGGPRAPEVVRTDSAGVEIVLNPATPEEVPVWAALDSVPSLRLGALEGRREEQFGSVADVLPLSGGGVAVLDRQAAEIRVFDPDGTYRITLGSRGEGPGELLSPVALGLLLDDSVAVYDARQRRVTHFASDGSLGPVSTLQGGPSGRPFRATFFRDGSLLGQTRWFANRDGALPPPTESLEVARDSIVVIRFGQDGAVLDTLDLIPGQEMVRSIRMRGDVIELLMRPTVFDLTNHVVAHLDGIISSVNDSFELRVLDVGDGHLLRIIRAPGLERSITDAMAEAIHRAALADAEDEEARRGVEAWFELSPRPAMAPAYDRIVVDDQSRIWVREWSRPDPSGRWWVLGPRGDLMGSVDVPPGLTIYAVRCGDVWGVEQDELDVSYVVRYGLEDVEPGPGCYGG